MVIHMWLTFDIVLKQKAWEKMADQICEDLANTKKGDKTAVSTKLDKLSFSLRENQVAARTHLAILKNGGRAPWKMIIITLSYLLQVPSLLPKASSTSTKHSSTHPFRISTPSQSICAMTMSPRCFNHWQWGSHISSISWSIRWTVRKASSILKFFLICNRRSAIRRNRSRPVRANRYTYAQKLHEYNMRRNSKGDHQSFGVSEFELFCIPAYPR